MKMKEQDFKDIGISKMNDLITLRDAQKKLKKMNFQDNRKYFEIVNEDVLHNTKLMSYYSEVNLIEENQGNESESSLTNSRSTTRRNKLSSIDEKTQKKGANTYFSHASFSSKSKKRTRKSSDSISITISSEWSKHNSEDNAIAKKNSCEKIPIDTTKKGIRQDDKYLNIYNDAKNLKKKSWKHKDHIREYGEDNSKSKTDRIKLSVDDKKISRTDYKKLQKDIIEARSECSLTSKSKDSSDSNKFFDDKHQQRLKKEKKKNAENKK